VIRDEQHPFSSTGNVPASSHGSKIKREPEKQETDDSRPDHGKVRSPNLQTRHYFSNHHMRFAWFELLKGKSF
jgi:hypothetical protein